METSDTRNSSDPKESSLLQDLLNPVDSMHYKPNRIIRLSGKLVVRQPHGTASMYFLICSNSELIGPNGFIYTMAWIALLGTQKAKGLFNLMVLFWSETILWSVDCQMPKYKYKNVKPAHFVTDNHMCVLREATVRNIAVNKTGAIKSETRRFVDFGPVIPFIWLRFESSEQYNIVTTEQIPAHSSSIMITRRTDKSPYSKI